jgi:endonuclease YncB( thermonuclease family)
MYEYWATPLRVVDGDTFVAMIDLGLRVSKQETLRLRGIDTPEMNSPDPALRAKAAEAKTRLYQLLGLGMTGAPRVRIRTEKPYETDKYGRWLADVILADERKVSAVLLVEGLAVPYMV